MKKISCLLLLLFFFVSPFSLNAQNLKDQVPSPKTKLEEFSARTGVVIIRGFEEIGREKFGSILKASKSDESFIVD